MIYSSVQICLFSNDCWKSNNCDQSQRVQTERLTNSWFSLTWWDVGVQSNDKMSLKFCIAIESNSQKTFSPTVLYTNMAALTSHEYQESEFLAIPCHWLKVWKKSRVEGAVSLGFASHWFQNWWWFKPITWCRNHVTTFDSNSCNIPTWHRS